MRSVNPDDDLAAVASMNLDRALPHWDGPIDTTLAITLGRRALRRRRRRAYATGFSAVAAAVGLGLLLVPGQAGPTSVDAAATGATGEASGPAVTSSAATSPGSTGPVGVASEPRPGSEFTVLTDNEPVVDPGAPSVDISDDGRLVVPPRTAVLGVIEEPMGYAAPSHSLAVAYRQPGVSQERWALLTLRPDLVAGGSVPLGVEEDGRGGVDQVAETEQSLAEWVYTQKYYGVFPAWPYSGLPDTPHIELDGRLVLPATARLVDRIENPLGLDRLRSVAIAWVDPGDSSLQGEQWAVLVSDPTWRPSQPGDPDLGLVNGFASDLQRAVPGVDFRDWVATQTAADFVANSVPEWAGGNR